MNDIKCYKCESKSVIEDGKIWTCWEHIKPCDCTKSHSLGSEWEYSGVYPATPITIEAMEFQMGFKQVNEQEN